MASKKQAGGKGSQKATKGTKGERAGVSPSPAAAESAVRTVEREFVEKVAVKCIVPTALNGRDPVNKKAAGWVAFVASVKARGVLEPLLLRPHPGTKGMFEIMAGQRRWTAAVEAELAHLPAMVGAYSDKQAMDIMLAENADREGLRPMESAREFAKALEMGYSAQELAAARKTSPGQVVRLANLVKLSKQWQDFAAEYDVGQVHLELIARYDKDSQGAIYDVLLKGRFSNFESAVQRYFLNPGSLHELREELGGLTHEIRLAPWDVKDVTLFPKAGACVGCAFRSDVVPDLFDEAGIDPKAQNRARCLKVDCWDTKMAAHQKRAVQALEKEHGKVLKISTEYEYGNDAKGLSMNGNEVVNRYDVLTKPTKGAVPALVVKGPKNPNEPGSYVKANPGDVVWLKPKERAKPSGMVVKLSPAEEKEALDRRVWAEVWKRVQVRLAAQDVPPVAFNGPHGALALVAAFGVFEDEVETWSGIEFNADETKLGRAERYAEAVSGSLVSWVWCAVRKDIGNLYFRTFAGAELVEIRKVCELIGLDVAKLAEEVRAEFAKPGKKLPTKGTKDTKADGADEEADEDEGEG